jgi:hypothetical protein
MLRVQPLMDHQNANAIEDEALALFEETLAGGRADVSN